MSKSKITQDQIFGRYHAGTMGYATCIILLKRDFNMTEAQADQFLNPPPPKSGSPGPQLLADLFNKRQRK